LVRANIIMGRSVKERRPRAHAGAERRAMGHLITKVRSVCARLP
jgi:hypothetical protein